MATICKYYFYRDNGSAAGLLSSQRASTDVINALEEWKSGNATRQYESLHQNDEIILAELQFDPADQFASDDLSKSCIERGIRRLSKDEYLKDLLLRISNPGATLQVPWGILGRALAGGDNRERSHALTSWVTMHGLEMSIGIEPGPNGYSDYAVVTVGKR